MAISATEEAGLLGRRELMLASAFAALAPVWQVVAAPGTARRSTDNHYSADDVRRFHRDPLGVIYDNPPDRLRYIYRNMTEFMPHGVLGRDPDRISRLDRAPERTLRLAQADIASELGTIALDDWVHHPESFIDGLIVLSRGRIAYEAYPRMLPSDRHILWSVTKVFVGLAVAILAERGLIDVDAPIGRYISGPENSGWKAVRIRDILDMASGIDAREQLRSAFTDPNDPYYRFEASIGYLPKRLDTRSTYDVVASYAQRVPPGTVFEYSSVNSFMLAWLVETVSGQAVHRFVADTVWRRIGAEADAVWVMSPQGAPGADGGLSMTLRDLARFGLQYCSASEGRNPVVSPRHVRTIQKTGRHALWQTTGDPLGKSADEPLYNCWQWDRVWSNGDFYKGGAGGQGLFVSPADQVVIANFGTPGGNRRNSLHNQCRTISRIVAGLR
jgi:CubicO group peptidase (beta-lactamase class C family)